MDSANWVEIADDALQTAGVPRSSIEVIANWDQRGCANAVYGIGGQQFLKVFGPEAEWQYQVERCMLTLVADRTSVPVPPILFDGRLASGRPFLILGGVPGSTAEHTWDQLSRPDQLRLAADLGNQARAIHDLPTEALEQVEREHGGWEIHNRRYRDHHVEAILETTAVPELQRQELIAFIDEEAPDHLNAVRVMTHFDMAHNHFYINEVDGRPNLCGLIDWGEATLGPAEWDLAYLWFWTFSGDRPAMELCLDAYFRAGSPPSKFGRRCLAAIFYTSSMALLWPEFIEEGPVEGSIVAGLTRSLFPVELFGDPT